MEIKHIVIVGPTASGKTALSLDIAKRFDGEIIAADSRTVYKGMNIGTAKPSPKDQKTIKHYCLDLVNPDDTFNVADFKEEANKALDAIKAFGKLALTVGGSGLYIDSFVYNYTLAKHDISVYQKYQSESIESLQQIIINSGLTMPDNYKNKRYLLSTIARGHQVTDKSKLPAHTIIIGINPGADVLKDRITVRAKYMFDNGVIDEVRHLTDKYGKSCRAMKGGIYSALQPYLEGEEDVESAKQRFIRSDWQMARRQMTWLKRNQDIIWFSDSDKANGWLVERMQGKL